MEAVITPQSPASDYLNWLGRTIHECVLPANDRVRAAASCLAISQDHHHAMEFLVKSSFVEINIIFQINGRWLAIKNGWRAFEIRCQA